MATLYVGNRRVLIFIHRGRYCGFCSLPVLELSVGGSKMLYSLFEYGVF